ncbi:serine/threonine-protein kinase 32B-like [Portunus trituberculatus]|uniref:serine/threonine-protein kinase 32B-like n=1 Tax=Portunus trituberculatus TaxID=210409 RepID=UPI001E1D0BD7|nr:serine/threonine-protein kinase 32B-like [Portunus trituberculatus]
MFAMKYVNKEQCQQREALNNVFREIEILASLSHPFLVNLWFSFQDAEDMFLVVELLVGGDLRYHLHQGVQFGDTSVRLFLLEAASALTYLHERNIIHRDIKPDNLLLDEEGHVHLTDFNIATVVKPGQLATSMSGTRPYMAPEVYECAADECLGYGAAVDWWSLGVAAYEVRRGRRPFDIHSSTSLADIRRMFQVTPRFSSDVDPGLAQMILGLLVLDPSRRVQSLEKIYKIPFMAEVAMEDVLNKKIKPAFTPPKDHLNCDPTFELEEMIIESRPLHKRSNAFPNRRASHTPPNLATLTRRKRRSTRACWSSIERWRREREERREREREEREQKWQEELEESMRMSDPTGHGCSFMGSQSSTPVKTKLGGQQGSSEVTRLSPLTPPTLTEADLQVTKAAVSPSSVRARIARSPKVKVRGTTVTIESPRSSSSSLTKSSTNYLQERLKELQADQRRAQTETETSSDDVTGEASQSQRRTEREPANHSAGMKGTQEEEEEVRLRSSRNNNNNNNWWQTAREAPEEREVDPRLFNVRATSYLLASVHVWRDV